MGRGEYLVKDEGGELVMEMNRPGDARALVVVRLGGPGVLDTDVADEPISAGAQWRVLLSTEDAEFASDPRPVRLRPGTP